MLIAGIDFEGTSLDTSVARVVEVGAVLYDTELDMPVRMVSLLVDPEREISAETTEITGITESLVKCHGASEQYAFADLKVLMEPADYCLAHFGNVYDYPLYKATSARLGADETGHLWLDSSIDIKYPERITTRNLKHLAAEHGFLNPFSHRAVFDVLTMLRIASQYDWTATIARAKEPTLYVQAMVDFKTNQKAKDFQFRWNPESKIWWESVKLSDWQNERGAYLFEVKMLDKAPE